MRSGMTVAIFLGITALPWLGQAQSPAVTRGLLGSPQSSQAGQTTMGVMRGAVPPGASVGAVRGAVPPNASVGVVRSGPQLGEVGLLRGATSPTNVGTFPPPDASVVGALVTSMPPSTRFGEPGPVDIAGRLTDEARRSLIDHDFAASEQLLNQSLTVREEAVGRDHPDVVTALEDNAALLRRYNREAAAADMDARAQEIRVRREAPAGSTPPSPTPPALTPPAIGAALE